MYKKKLIFGVAHLGIAFHFTVVECNFTCYDFNCHNHFIHSVGMRTNQLISWVTENRIVGTSNRYITWIDVIFSLSMTSSILYGLLNIPNALTDHICKVLQADFEQLPSNIALTIQQSFWNDEKNVILQ